MKCYLWCKQYSLTIYICVLCLWVGKHLVHIIELHLFNLTILGYSSYLFPCTVGPVPIQEEMDKKRSADVIKGGIEKVNEPGRKTTVNVVCKDQNMDGIPDARSTMVTRTRVRRETVKHMIYQNC